MEKKAYIFCFSALLVFWHTQNKLPELITMAQEIFCVSCYPVLECESAFLFFAFHSLFFLFHFTFVRNNGQNDEASILQCSRTLTVVTGETNCQRVDLNEKWRKCGRKRENKKRKCQACSSGTEFGAYNSGAGARGGAPVEWRKPAEQNKEDCKTRCKMI